MKEHLFDKRVVQRALQEGLIDQAAYQRMLDELPDLAHRVQATEPSEEPVATRTSLSPSVAESLQSTAYSPEF